MQFPHGESRLSGIEPACEENDNDSIINQLNLLDNGFESRVVKVESFLYAQEAATPQSLQKRTHESFLHDFDGNIIPPISSRHLSPYNLIGGQSNHRMTGRNEHGLSSRPTHAKEQDKRQVKKSIREEIMQENKLLERRLSLNKHYITSFPAPRHQIPTVNIISAHPQALESIPCEKKAEETAGDKLEEVRARLEEQYNRSKVVKLYNFILREVPKCSHCDGLRIHLAKEGNGVALKCKECEQGQHPFIAVLYDLENKGRFEEEVTAFQAAIDSIGVELATLQEQTRGLEALREKVVCLKNLNRKKYKQINESKFFLRKHLGNLQYSHFVELQRLLPKEYLEQLDLWSEIRQQHAKWLQGAAAPLTRIMPVHLLQSSSASKLLDSLHRLLNYEKEQAVKISVSEGIKFPIKRMDCAVFVVDGSYSLPVFEDVRHLQLEFQNKKTLRELNLLFSNFPRQVYSLAFSYNHKVHSHISAEAFPFLRFVAALPALSKLHVTIENVKDFADVLEMAGVMTPKAELRIAVTKHIFSKNGLNLPFGFYQTLFAKLGSQVTKIELDLPESVDSPAVVNYQQLLSLKYLCVFRLQRGDKQSKDVRKMKVLQSESSETDFKKQLVFKKAMAHKASCLKAIKNLSSLTSSKPAVESILMFLL